MRILRHLLLALGLASGLAAQPKEKVIIISWGDLLGNKTGDARNDAAIQLDTPENIQKAAELWKSRGVSKVLFRVDDWRYVFFHDFNPLWLERDDPSGRIRRYHDAIERTWK